MRISPTRAHAHYLTAFFNAFAAPRSPARKPSPSGRTGSTPPFAGPSKPRKKRPLEALAA
jgi:hypothetical protein